MSRWCLEIADDIEVLGLLAGLEEDKRQPNLVLAAARFDGAEDGDYDRSRRFMLDNWESVRRTILTHRTQTNEVGRGALLLPVLAGLAGQISLVEVGASGGLCLFPDRMGYRYDGGSRVDRRVTYRPRIDGCPNPLPLGGTHRGWWSSRSRAPVAASRG